MKVIVTCRGGCDCLGVFPATFAYPALPGSTPCECCVTPLLRGGSSLSFMCPVQGCVLAEHVRKSAAYTAVF